MCVCKRKHQLHRPLLAATDRTRERQAQQTEFRHAAPTLSGHGRGFRVATVLRRIFTITKSLHGFAQGQVIVI